MNGHYIHYNKNLKIYSMSNMVICADLLNRNCRTLPGKMSWRQERVKLLRACAAAPDLRLLIILTGKLGGRTQIRYSRPDKKVELRVAARLTGHCHWGVNVNVMYNQESMDQVSCVVKLHQQFKDRRHMVHAPSNCHYHSVLQRWIWTIQTLLEDSFGNFIVWISYLLCWFCVNNICRAKSFT